jgi:hypothetical protein
MKTKSKFHSTKINRPTEEKQKKKEKDREVFVILLTACTLPSLIIFFTFT